MSGPFRFFTHNQLARRLVGSRIVAAPPTPLVSFTFDDVPETALTGGASILEQHGARGTFYVSGALVGCGESDVRPISREGVCDLARRGHEIGCHTFSHRSVRGMSRSELDADLARNARFRGELVAGVTGRNFAYPYNQASVRCGSVLRRRFRSARAGMPGINRGRVNVLHLNAIEIAQPEDTARLTGWIDAAAANPGWLIFFTHDVSERPSGFGSTRATLGHLVSHALASGCDVVTIDQALDRLGVPDLAAVA